MDLVEQEPGEEDTSLTLAVNEDSPAQTLSDLAEMGDDYDSTIVGIEPGAGLMRLTQDSVIPTYGLEDWELIESSTPAMLGAVQSATKSGGGNRRHDVTPALGVRGVPATRPGG